jgi:glycosyltransferase involved in cell wall biosynthesis
MSSVHLVVPDTIDDASRPSGGNVYDRRLHRGLRELRWLVHEHRAVGAWPDAGAEARGALAAVVAQIPDGGVVVVDGLIGSAVPELLVPHADRLRVVVLVHMPLGLGEPGQPLSAAGRRERAVLERAAAVLTTSRWARARLLEQYRLEGARVHVAEPGADAADLALGSACGGSLLCVAAVSAHKGHDLLLAALAMLGDRSWTCDVVGSLTRDPAFVDRLRSEARAQRIDRRVRFVGALGRRDLDAAYARADVLVHASRCETYGMVVTEALARGVPVVATAVGGVPDALGRASDGTRPGLLVPAADAVGLAGTLRRWLDDDALRLRLRAAAHERRARLEGWDSTARVVERVLAQVAAA